MRNILNKYGTYLITFDVHCELNNYFGLKIKIKNCNNELHAKVKLNAYCKKKYELFEYIIIKSSKYCSSDDISFGDYWKDQYPESMSEIFNKFKDSLK